MHELTPTRRRTNEMRLGQASFLEDDDDIEVISEHAGDSLDFLSENLTTEMDRRSPLYDGDK